MSKYIYFTEEQKERARRTDLASFLQSNGESLKRSGSEYEWKSKSGKVTVRGNIWFHQYEREGGDAIDFVRRFYNLDFAEAVNLLLSEQGITVVPQEKTTKEKKEFCLPKVNQDMRRVYAYLLKGRFIDHDVINFFTKEKLIYEDAEYHNAVFVGMDEDGVPRHAHKRGTYSKSVYKGNVEGSNPDYSFHYIGKGNKLYVFEAPIDMLSYISLHKENWQEHSYVALCSVAPQSVIHILKNNPQIESVYICLDHDKAGIEGNYRIEEEVKKLGDYTVEKDSPAYKDWNESLKNRNGIEPIPATEHPGLIRMKVLCRELVSECKSEKIKYPLGVLQRYNEKLKRYQPEQRSAVMEQSLKMSRVAFLLAKKQLAAMEKSQTDEQLAKALFMLYPPHRDNCGYKTRIADIGERVEEIVKVYRKNEILTESQQMENVKTMLSLSVDCLRLYMFEEQSKLKQEEGENVCQILQHSLL
ncbi:MAG: DUF3991 domain-containing protein [Eubacterium sp.]|nr:DUF3991 domain-containing protein [Eubacterium sp.]